MSRLSWGQKDRLYEYGVDRGVLYTDGSGVAWDGLTGVEEVVSDSAVTSYYFDGIKTIDVMSSSDFAIQLSALFSPEQFDAIEENHLPFELSYRTKMTSGYKIHIVYNATAIPSGKVWQTATDTTTPMDFVWDISTRPTHIPSATPSAHLVVDTSQANPIPVAELEDFLYGTEDTDPTLPTAAEVIDIFLGHATLVIINHGDGTWTAIGPDDVVSMIDDTTFQIDWPSVVYIDVDKYTVSSM